MAIAVLIPSASDIESHLSVGLEFAKRMDDSLVALCIAPAIEAADEGSAGKKNAEQTPSDAETVKKEYKEVEAKRQFKNRVSFLEQARASLQSRIAESPFDNVTAQAIEIPNAPGEISSALQKLDLGEETVAIRCLIIPVIRGTSNDQGWAAATRLFEVAQCQTVLLSIAPNLTEVISLSKIALAGNNRHDINIARQFARGLSAEVIIEATDTSDLQDLKSIVIGIPGRAGQTNVDHCTSWNELRRDDKWDLVALVNPADSWPERMYTALDEKLRHLFHDYQLPRKKRQMLSDKLFGGATASAEFVLFMSLATFLACIGLIQNSAAVIIGAMLVAPLMTPLLAAGLAMLFGHDKLFRKAVKAIVIGVAISFMIGFLLGNVTLILPVWLFSGNGLTLTNEMIARSQPNMLDPFIGLAAGLAGGFAIGRDGQIGAVAGVAIAAALVPPIATAGLEAAIIAHICWMEGSFSAVGSLLGTDPGKSLLEHNMLRDGHLPTANVQLVLAPLLLFVLNACATIIGANIGLRMVGMHRRGRPRQSKHWVGIAFFILLLTIIFLMLLPFMTYSV